MKIIGKPVKEKGEARERKREGKSFHWLPRIETFQGLALTPGGFFSRLPLRGRLRCPVSSCALPLRMSPGGSLGLLHAAPIHCRRYPTMIFDSTGRNCSPSSVAHDTSGSGGARSVRTKPRTICSAGLPAKARPDGIG